MDSKNSVALDALRQCHLTQNPSVANWHEFWLHYCLQLAWKGWGHTAPNPLVGAVLLRPKAKVSIKQFLQDGAVLPKQFKQAKQFKECWPEYFELLGEGYHAAYGQLHAEAAAFADAYRRGYGPKDFQEAILYCNLEPCCFMGKHKHQPPCSQQIIAQKTAAVVFANTDPNPLVSGQGVQALRRAGVLVEHGYLAQESAAINQVFFGRMQATQAAQVKRPWVVLKLAQSLDGRIATKSGHSQWISGPMARQMVQALRCGNGLASSAVCVGRGTLEADNPSLLLRPSSSHTSALLSSAAGGLGQRQQIRRVVWDSQLRSVGKELQFYAADSKQHSIVLHSASALKAKREWLRQCGVAAVGVVPSLHSSEGMHFALQTLAEEPHGIDYLLVEGGAKLASSLLAAGLVDELYCFVSLRLIGEGLSSLGDICPQRPVLSLQDTCNLQWATTCRIAEDWDGPDELLCHGYLRELYVP